MLGMLLKPSLLLWRPASSDLRCLQFHVKALALFETRSSLLVASQHGF